MPYSSTPPGVVSLGKTGGTQLKGAVTLTEGTSITITTSGQAITIAAAAGGSIPTAVTTATSFEDSARFSLATSNGTNTFGGSVGCTSSANGTSAGYAQVRWLLSADTAVKLYNNSPTWSNISSLDTIATTASFYLGIGRITTATTGHTFTGKHIGFKILTAAGTASLYATQADGTTENASAALTTVVNFDTIELVLEVNSSTSVDYYWAKNGGARSAATNLTANMPTVGSDAEHSCQASVSSDNSTGAPKFVIHAMSYTR